MRDIGSKTESSLIWNTSLKIIYQIFRFGISIVIARILEPKDFGIMGIATMIVFYANSITNFGLNRALIHKEKINESHINTIFTIDIAISLFLTVATVLFSSRISGFFKTPELTNVILSLSCVFLLTSFYQMPVTILKRQLNFKIVAITELYRGVVQSCLTLILALLGFEYWALVIGLIASHISGLFYIFSKVEWKPRIRYDHGALKDVFDFGLWNFIRSQSLHINEYADKFIIGKFLGPVYLGFYEKAFSTVAMQKSNFSMQIDSVMFSSFSRLQTEAKSRITSYLQKSITITSLLTFPLNTGFIVLGSPLVMVLLGEKWEPMIVSLKILAAAFMFSTLNGLMASMNIGIGSYMKQTIREGAGNLLLIIACLMGVQKGIEFVAVGVLLIYALIFVITFHLSKETIDIRWKDLFEIVLPAAVGSVIMALAVLFFKIVFFNKVNLLNLVLLSGIGVLTYLLTVFVPGYSNLEELRCTIVDRIKNVYNRHGLFRVKKSENQ